MSQLKILCAWIGREFFSLAFEAIGTRRRSDLRCAASVFESTWLEIDDTIAVPTHEFADGHGGEFEKDPLLVDFLILLLADPPHRRQQTRLCPDQHTSVPAPEA